ncbi:hypothetical protein GmHk_17G047649 [Glycine max]|nr:hypothetical protein GmHk_17G047649 [Glycine max]KAH1200766.1 hypothetical protein GmHk_17G047649 [Glycine max]
MTYRDGRGRDDYYSPERSRSYSRSLSPSGGKDYRKSPRLRENGRSPNDKKDQTPSRSESPRGNDRSPSRSRSRSYSQNTIFKSLKQLEFWKYNQSTLICEQAEIGMWNVECG